MSMTTASIQPQQDEDRELQLKLALAKAKRKVFSVLPQLIPAAPLPVLPAPKVDKESDFPEARVRVDGTVFIDEETIEKRDPGFLAFLVAHEMLHVTLGSFERRGERHPIIWNIASDIVIHTILEHTELWRYIPDDIKPRIATRDAYGLDDMSAEETYDALISKAKIDPETCMIIIDLPQGGDGDEKQNGAGGAGTEQGEGDRDSKDRIPKPLLDQMRKEVAREFKRIGMPGTMSAEIEKFISEILVPECRLPLFEDMLVVGNQVMLTYDKPCTRSVDDSIILPGEKWLATKVGVALDVSGSMEGGHRLEKALGVIKKLMDMGYQIHVVEGDTTVTLEFDRPDDIEAMKKIRGLGGTDVRPMVDRLVESDDEISAIFIITDGEVIEWPENRYPVPLIAVLVGSEDIQVPPWIQPCIAK